MIKTLIQILACNLVGMPPRRTELAAAGGFERIRRIRAHHVEPAQCRQDRIGIAQIQRRPANNFATDDHWPGIPLCSTPSSRRPRSEEHTSELQSLMRIS